MTLRRPALLLASLLAASGCDAPTPADAFRQDQQALQRGKSLFIGTCAGYCHSPTAERAAPNLFDCTWKHGGGSDQGMFDTIANGVPGTQMIAFKGKLPEGDDDIWRLVAYISATRADCDAG